MSTPPRPHWLIETTIALATVPALAAIVGTKVLATAAQDLGAWSEELFRGDRLPALNLPPDPPTDP